MLFRSLGTGTRIGSRHLDCRWSNVRILGDRQSYQSDNTDDDDTYGYHHRGDGPINKSLNTHFLSFVTFFEVELLLLKSNTIFSFSKSNIIYSAAKVIKDSEDNLKLSDISKNH